MRVGMNEVVRYVRHILCPRISATTISVFCMSVSVYRFSLSIPSGYMKGHKLYKVHIFGLLPGAAFESRARRRRDHFPVGMRHFPLFQRVQSGF